MSITDLISSLWKSDQKNWALLSIDAPAAPPLPDALPYRQTMGAHQAYVTFVMRSMQIASTRVAWSKFHAALYTQASFVMKDGNVGKIQSVLSPDFLRDLDSDRIENVLHIDRTIFGPVPYVGNALSVETGVFAIKHADLAAPFLTCLTDLASVAGVALVSAAEPFIGPIKSGFELLTGTADATSLEIALSRELQPPQTGWYVLLRLPGAGLKGEDFKVDPNNFELRRKGDALSGVPYLVFSVEGTTRRADWAQIPALKAAYADFVKAASAGNQNEANDAVKLFERRARLSPELLRTHVDDVIAAVKDEFQKLFPGGPTSGAKGGARGIADLAQLNVRFRKPE